MGDPTRDMLDDELEHVEEMMQEADDTLVRLRSEQEKLEDLIDSILVRRDILEGRKEAVVALLDEPFEDDSPIDEDTPLV